MKHNNPTCLLNIAFAVAVDQEFSIYEAGEKSHRVLQTLPGLSWDLPESPLGGPGARLFWRVGSQNCENLVVSKLIIH